MEKTIYQERPVFVMKMNLYYALPGGTGKNIQASRLLQMKTLNHIITICRVGSVTIFWGLSLTHKYHIC